MAVDDGGRHEAGADVVDPPVEERERQSMVGPLVGAVAVAAVGIALTTFGAFAHHAALMAPGSLLILLGGGGLGYALALRGVRLYPAPKPPDGGKGPTP